MKKHTTHPKLRSHNPAKFLPIVLVCLLFAGVGVYFLVFAHAESNSTTQTCITPTSYPSAPNGGMTYTNWDFNTGPISSLQSTFTVYNNPGTTSDLYMQFYDANIDGTGQYYGLQTTGLALFSRFGTTDTSNVQPASGSTVVTGTNEGPFVSLRYNYGSLPTGTYSIRMTRGNYDGTGDWFDYYVTYPGQEERYIGAIRFPRASSGVPASFADGGGSWTEFWDNNGSTLYPVPVWHISTSIVANGSVRPNSAYSTYSAMPNSDIYAESAGGTVDMLIGGSTPRCHTAGWLWYNNNVAAPAPAVSSTRAKSTPTPVTATTPVKTTPAPTATTPAVSTPIATTPQTMAPSTSTKTLPSKTAFNDAPKSIQVNRTSFKRKALYSVAGIIGIVGIVLGMFLVRHVLLIKRLRKRAMVVNPRPDYDKAVVVSPTQPSTITPLHGSPTVPPTLSGRVDQPVMPDKTKYPWR